LASKNAGANMHASNPVFVSFCCQQTSQPIHIASLRMTSEARTNDHDLRNTSLIRYWISVKKHSTCLPPALEITVAFLSKLSIISNFLSKTSVRRSLTKNALRPKKLDLPLPFMLN